MTKAELEQLLDLRKEICELDARVEKLQRDRGRQVVDNLLLRRRQQAVEAEYKISQYIKSIKDSRIRRIISLRYEEGLSWRKVADAMNCDRTYPEKLLSKYLEGPENRRKRRK